MTRPLIKRPLNRQDNEDRRPLIQSPQSNYGVMNPDDNEPPEILTVDPTNININTAVASTHGHQSRMFDTISTETFESCSTDLNASFQGHASTTSSMNNFLTCSTHTPEANTVEKV